MKNIVICLDGTWNKPDDKENAMNDDNENTNVLRLYELLSNDNKQVTYYDSGVGTEWYDKLIGGISGVGLSENIMQAYEFISRSWLPGDNVFLFGFSRGAYTARSLAGMIYSCGLPKSKTDENKIIKAFQVYKHGSKSERSEFKFFNLPCPIKTIGVWDTVGALGIPLTLLKGINSKLSQFHDTKINKEVKFAFHALALDEQRENFNPTLWDETEINDGQIIEQVWFSGVHSDIGGGYFERFYSDITLQWMIKRIQSDIIFNDKVYNYSNNSMQCIHDSYRIFFGARATRSLPSYGETLPCLHHSVLNSLARPDYNCMSLSKLINKKTLSPYRVTQ